MGVRRWKQPCATAASSPEPPARVHIGELNCKQPRLKIQTHTAVGSALAGMQHRMHDLLPRMPKHVRTQQPSLHPHSPAVVAASAQTLLLCLFPHHLPLSLPCNRTCLLWHLPLAWLISHGMQHSSQHSTPGRICSLPPLPQGPLKFLEHTWGASLLHPPSQPQPTTHTLYLPLTPPEPMYILPTGPIATPIPPTLSSLSSSLMYSLLCKYQACILPQICVTQMLVVLSANVSAILLSWIISSLTLSIVPIFTLPLRLTLLPCNLFFFF